MQRNLLTCCAVLLVGCSGLSVTNQTGSGGNGGPTASLTIQNYSYAPPTITVQVGTKVTWTNNGPAAHSVTSDSTGFDSGALAAPMGNTYGGMTSGGIFQVTFNTPGSYSYHCMFHAQMHGTITVQ
ncbi:MAG TPA: plastocyanin/azurin family copper-binding protein [Gemmatimonadales bacterium]|nr:plastocyanin/azurin family copper-binding protein [Gemmatimonadales bacterium]